MDTNVEKISAAEAAVTGWFILSAKSRIDSFNQNALRDQLRQAQSSGFKQIALDVHSTRFISLAAIQFLVQFAKDLKVAGGEFALLSPSEKSKRHFEIYGTLNAIRVIRNATDVEIGKRAELGLEGSSSSMSESYRPEHPSTEIR